MIPPAQKFKILFPPGGSEIRPYQQPSNHICLAKHTRARARAAQEAAWYEEGLKLGISKNYVPGRERKSWPI
jgi:hypothetical protein